MDAANAAAMPRILTPVLSAIVVIVLGCNAHVEPEGTRQAQPASTADRFPCGKGSCERKTQICVIADGCSTCSEVPAACTSAPTCACVPSANTEAFGGFRCEDPGTCAEDGGGVVVTCTTRSQWSCG